MRAFSWVSSLALVTWHHSIALLIRRSRKPHATCKLHCCIFYITAVNADRSFTLREWEFGPFWLLWPGPRPDDLYIRTKSVCRRHTGCAKMNDLRQGFRKLSYFGARMCAFSYAWSLPVTWQRWQSHHSIHHSGKSPCYMQTSWLYLL